MLRQWNIMANSQTSIHFEKVVDGEKWSTTYCKSIGADGSYFFPKKLSPEYLKRQRKAQGSYIFAHQYQSEIIPSDNQDFKKEWIKYYTELPKIKQTFAFFDPAISLEDTACYTALVVVDVDLNNDWFVKVARRLRITATETIALMFKVQELFKCNIIGVEIIAYQMAIMHFLDAEMKRRKTIVPVHGVNPGNDRSKNMRIRSLVPRFEWGHIYLKPGLVELEDELMKFPRGTFVDILDALSSIEEIAYPPEKPKERISEPAPNSPFYEKWYIGKLLAEKRALED